MDQRIVRATLATKRNPVAESNARQGFRRNICTFSGAPCGDECPRHQRHLTIACIVREHARLVSLSADRNKDCARIRASSKPFVSRVGSTEKGAGDRCVADIVPCRATVDRLARLVAGAAAWHGRSAAGAQGHLPRRRSGWRLTPLDCCTFWIAWRWGVAISSLSCVVPANCSAFGSIPTIDTKGKF